MDGPPTSKLRLLQQSATGTAALSADSLCLVFGYVGGLTSPFASVNRTWAFAHCSFMQRLATAPLSRAMKLDVSKLVLKTSEDNTPIDLNQKSGRQFRFEAGSRTEILGGPPARNLILSGPRTAVVACIKGAPLPPREAKAPKTAASPDTAGAEHDSPSAAAADATESAAAPGAAATKPKPLRPVKVSGESIFRGITIEGDIIVGSGHLIMVRCDLRGSISVQARAELTMIECDLRGSNNKYNRIEDQTQLVNVGKDASCKLERCTLTTTWCRCLHAQTAANIVVLRCKFSANGIKPAIEMSCGKNRMEKGCDKLVIRDCTFTDGLQPALFLVRCLPKICVIDGLHIVRTKSNQLCRAVFANYPAGFLRIKNVSFTDVPDSPQGDADASAPAADEAPMPRALPKNFFHTASRISLGVDATADMMRMPVTALHESVICYCRSSGFDDLHAMVADGDRKLKRVGEDGIGLSEGKTYTTFQFGASDSGQLFEDSEELPMPSDLSAASQLTLTQS